MKQLRTNADIARHIIDFDQEDPKTHSELTDGALLIPAKALKPIPFPKTLAPKPAPIKPAPTPSLPLPKCDYLVVTWTVAEARALADVLTPGFPSKTAWYYYAHKFASDYAAKIRKGAPASSAKRLGSYFVTKVGKARVLCFKSELHMSQDGPKLPIADLWNQLLDEVQPRLVITTGTAGGIGSDVELGDVVVTGSVRFDCTKTFKKQKFAQATYTVPFSPKSAIHRAEQELLPANADRLGPENRLPKIYCPGNKSQQPLKVVTTDFFAFDDEGNNYSLQGLGAAVEMGDAVLGMVAKSRADAPPWLAVRNVSDPQIPTGANVKAEAQTAAKIYEMYGYWTTVASAIASWACVVADAGAKWA